MAEVGVGSILFQQGVNTVCMSNPNYKLTELRPEGGNLWPRFQNRRRRLRPGPEIPAPAAHRRRNAGLK